MTLDPKVREFLCAPNRFAVLATVNPDGTVQQTVMWYDLRGDAIMMNTKRGRKKEQNLRQNPRISICVEDGYRYVAISGTAELVEDPATGQRDIRALAVKYHGEAKAEEQVRSQFSKEERVTILLRPESVIADGLD